MSRDILVVKSWIAGESSYWYLVGQGQRCAQYSVMHKAHLHKNLFKPFSNAGVEKPGFILTITS